MIQFAILFAKPPDPAAFDSYYDDIHVPLAHRLPGLERLEIVRFTGDPTGEAPSYHQLTALYFADVAAMEMALASPEGQATAADVESFPGQPERTLMIGEVA